MATHGIDGHVPRVDLHHREAAHHAAHLARTHGDHHTVQKLSALNSGIRHWTTTRRAAGVLPATRTRVCIGIAAVACVALAILVYLLIVARHHHTPPTGCRHTRDCAHLPRHVCVAPPRGSADTAMGTCVPMAEADRPPPCPQGTRHTLDGGCIEVPHSA